MWLHAAPVEDKIVVSEIGEIWSPNTAPAKIEPSTGIIKCAVAAGVQIAAPIGMSSAIVPHEVPVAKEMPILVNIGVLLDVFIAIYILGLFVSQINKELGDMEVAHLSDLKDSE